MTVAELIAELEKMPQQSGVVIEWDLGEWYWIDQIVLDEPDTNCVTLTLKSPSPPPAPAQSGR